jgi:hypothetical protein
MFLPKLEKQSISPKFHQEVKVINAKYPLSQNCHHFGITNLFLGS